jgi:biopolymer transport protein ExbD
MAAWKIRHEGSPQHLETTLDQIRQGLIDGAWETTDEVMGPGEAEWVPIEVHPQLEELAAEIEPPPAGTYDDETRLDMTALIDVCLVLLVFFILTTTVAVLSVRVEAPQVEETNNKAKVKVVTEKQVNQMILVKATMEGGRPVIRVEDEVVEMPRLPSVLARYLKGEQRKTQVMLDQDGEVPHNVEVQVIAAAKSVGLDGVLLLVDKK